MNTRSSKVLAGMTALAAGLSMAVAAMPASYAADAPVSVAATTQTTKGASYPNTASLGLKLVDKDKALPGCTTDAWTLALRPADLPLTNVSGKSSINMLDFAPFFADTQTNTVDNGMAIEGVKWTSNKVTGAMSPAEAGVTSGDYMLAAVCVNDTGDKGKDDNQANFGDHMPVSVVVKDGKAITSEWLKVSFEVADGANDALNNYTVGGVVTPIPAPDPEEKAAPWASGKADIWVLEKDGAWFFDGSKGTGKREFTWMPGAKTDVTMLNQYNWLGGPKMDLIERRTDGKLTIQIDGQGTPQEIGANWGSMIDLVPMGGAATGEDPFLIARHKSGDLYGYVYNPSVKRLQGVGVIGKRWTAMSSLFSVGNSMGDAKSDLLAINGRNNTLYGFIGKGGSRIGDAIRIGGGWGGFKAITPGNVNGDRYTDMVGLRSDGSLHLYAGNGKGFNASTPLGGGINYNAVRAIG